MKNKIRFGICSWCLPDTGIQEKQSEANAIFSMVKALDLEGIELDMGSYSAGLPTSLTSTQGYLLEASKHYDIEMPTLGVNALCEYGMGKVEKISQVREILSSTVQTAKALGIRLIQLPSFFDGFIRSEEQLHITALNLRYGCDLALEDGCFIASENDLSTEENMRLLALVDRPNFKLYFDNSNPFWMAGLSPAPMVNPLSPYICEYHIKDEFSTSSPMERSFIALGTGGSQVQETITCIKKTGYTGWVHLENSYNGLPLCAEEKMNLLAEDSKRLKAYF
jgi:sugar phosphate isomerase/epimerase